MSYSKSNEIELDCGITMELVALNQYYTYEGLLEGLPTTSKNEYKIETAVASAKDHWGTEPHLIQPAETPIILDHEYPFGVPASIPVVASLGLWRSRHQPAGEEFGCTELTIVWFQPEFGLPSDESTLNDLKALDWSSLATFREF